MRYRGAFMWPFAALVLALASWIGKRQFEEVEGE